MDWQQFGQNGECIEAAAAMGFGFIEIGTVTPRPQPGNDKPRMFRIVEAEGIINRMGFNNLGVDNLVENVKKPISTAYLALILAKTKTPRWSRAKRIIWFVWIKSIRTPAISLSISHRPIPWLTYSAIR